MPRYGTTMESGVVTEWFVKAGDTVKKGDKLCVIESEKLSNELEAFQDGVIDQVLVAEGDEADVGQPIAVMK